MVSPKKSSSSMRRMGSSVDIMADQPRLCWRDIMKRSKRKTSMMLLWTVMSWAAFSTLYLTSVIDRRSLAASIAFPNSHLRPPPPPGVTIRAPPGQRSLGVKFKKLSSENKEDDDDTSLDTQIQSLAPLSLSETSEDVPQPERSHLFIDQASSGDIEEDVPDGYIESNDIPDDIRQQKEMASRISPFFKDDEAQATAEGTETEETASQPDEGPTQETDIVEVSIESDSEQNQAPTSTCDLLPLRGGRYFWRNRQRLVDLDKSEICGPKIIIIGAKKCGTTNIADMLLRHPRMRFNSCNLKNTMGGCRVGWFQGALKQGEVFDGDDFTHVRRRMSNGWLDEFGKRLPASDGVTTFTFDKSPSYMDISFFPEVTEYAKAHLPNAKIVATLCNPAERLYSEFHSLLAEPYQGYKQLYWDNGVEPPTDFGAFVNLFHDEGICSEKEGFCDTNQKQYLKQGSYLHNLRPWFDAYGQENVLVVNMDDEPSKIVKSLLQLVGDDLLPEAEYPWEEVAEPFATNVNKAYEGRVSSYQYFNDEMQWLEEHYSQQNEDLAQFLDEDWPRRWNCRLNGDCDRFTW